MLFDSYVLPTIEKAILSTNKAVLTKVGVDYASGQEQTAFTEICTTCKNPNLQQAGACKVCPSCGTTTGCS